MLDAMKHTKTFQRKVKKSAKESNQQGSTSSNYKKLAKKLQHDLSFNQTLNKDSTSSAGSPYLKNGGKGSGLFKGDNEKLLTEDDSDFQNLENNSPINFELSPDNEDSKEKTGSGGTSIEEFEAKQRAALRERLAKIKSQMPTQGFQWK